MRVVTRRFEGVKRADVFKIIPIGDVHIGSAACDEGLFRTVVNRIAKEENTYTILMGDYCEFINTKDKRFEPEILAPWISVADLVDLGRAQRDYFLDIVLPIADKVLCVLEGNHEAQFKRNTERDVYSEIVTAIKQRGKHPVDEPLGVEMSGWLRTTFNKGGPMKVYRWRLHHGFVGGRLAGAKALNMQRWLWNHDCDFALFGHSHNISIQPESVEYLDCGGNVRQKIRRGAFTGTFMRSYNEDGPPIYSERRGFFPMPVGGVEIEIRPHTKAARKVRMIYDS